MYHMHFAKNYAIWVPPSDKHQGVYELQTVDKLRGGHQLHVVEVSEDPVTQLHRARVQLSKYMFMYCLKMFKINWIKPKDWIIHDKEPTRSWSGNCCTFVANSVGFVVVTQPPKFSMPFPKWEDHGVYRWLVVRVRVVIFSILVQNCLTSSRTKLLFQRCQESSRLGIQLLHNAQ